MNISRIEKSNVEQSKFQCRVLIMFLHRGQVKLLYTKSYGLNDSSDFYCSGRSQDQNQEVVVLGHSWRRFGSQQLWETVRNL